MFESDTNSCTREHSTKAEEEVLLAGFEIVLLFEENSDNVEWS